MKVVHEARWENKGPEGLFSTSHLGLRSFGVFAFSKEAFWRHLLNARLERQFSVL